MTITFITFKKYLTDNNILLFDSQYRIAHFRYNNLINNLNINSTNNLIGGALNNNNNNNIIIKLNNITLQHFINSLLNKNTERINWIINNCV